MRKSAAVSTGIATGVFGAVVIATPAYAAFHDRVANPYLHTLLDILTLVAVTSPLWTAYLWGAHRRRGLLGLIALVQLPVAVFSFVPIADPALHVVAIGLSLTITVTALWYVRRAATAPEAVAKSAVPPRAG